LAENPHVVVQAHGVLQRTEPPGRLIDGIVPHGRRRNHRHAPAAVWRLGAAAQAAGGGGREPGAFDGAAVRAGRRGHGPGGPCAARHRRQPRAGRRHCDDNVRRHDAGAAAAAYGRRPRLREAVVAPQLGARAERAPARRGGRGRRERGAALCLDAYAVSGAAVPRGCRRPHSGGRRAVCVRLRIAAAVVDWRRVSALCARRSGAHVAQVQRADDAAVAATAGPVSGPGRLAGDPRL
ncbi:hypothetical protein IWW52_006841, partial [Coemansia sp. RSA 2704]